MARWLKSVLFILHFIFQENYINLCNADGNVGETAIILHSTPSKLRRDAKDVQDVHYRIPAIEERLKSLNVVVQLEGFQKCSFAHCRKFCGSRNPAHAYCDKKNRKLCMCNPVRYHPSSLPGTILAVDRDNMKQLNCSIACNKRFSYGRIWRSDDNSESCMCLRNQTTSLGLTRCDPWAHTDICDTLCQTESGICAFNGVCLCNDNWEPFFDLSMPHIRNEVEEDKKECSLLCSGYHHDYIGRYYDSKLYHINTPKTYEFREKYCLCGPWMDIIHHPLTTGITKQGFQLCTGLKCKQRCGMDEATCEPIYRRACLCPRENIIIGNHLWSRLPSGFEYRCYDVCHSHGLDARVIEWNPFMVPENIKFQPVYKHSTFQYVYDGKFCHCVKPYIDMHQFRPCTDELCRMMCDHQEAICDPRTRRACFCKTDKLMLGLGRRPDPGEITCEESCRFGLYEANILDIIWNTTVASWGVPISKYCVCTQMTTLAGLTHCNQHPDRDNCPKYCGHPKAFCTKEKYCHCGIVKNILKNNPMIRLSNGKENDECGEKCRSWLYPLAEDVDNKPYIYDESRENCASIPKTCPKVDTSPWKFRKASQHQQDEQNTTLTKHLNGNRRKFCLCVKSQDYRKRPGTRFLPNLEPERVDYSPSICMGNHTCVIVGNNSLHIVAK